MTNYSTAIVAALLANSAVSNIVGTKIFLEYPPTDAAFPCVTFSQSIQADTGADNLIKSQVVFFNVECWVRNGSAWALASAVETVFVAQGYVCQSAQDAPPSGGLYQVIMKFQNTKEV